MGAGVIASSPGRIRRWFAGLGFAQMWRLVVLLVLAATAAFGGLDGVNTAVTVFEPGQQFSDGQYTLTVDRASVVEQIDGVLYDNPGSQYLGVVVQIRNDGNTPGNLLRTLKLQGFPNQRLVGAYRMADSTYNTNLGPGLSQETAFFWELPDGSFEPGATVTLKVPKKKFTELMVSYGEAWIDDATDYGQVTVPVKLSS
ncbi:hypothetical protein BVC93_25235 [Mycobacterium sp. MS1601]|uniref:hypothetical protein n=1 Tax=Mycobacterium sp. MS1601 TaxID=1936029 RepID=UPI0009796C8B|nr:hypothetical protein [Mycobacterium sp. MS1601]AQA05160.1 hypothetical protein BVC93_25235 [Mycobacterium sp. MS1601]